MNNKSFNHGGAREGAGRPRGLAKVPIYVRISPTVRFMLDVMGGSLSAHVEHGIWREYCEFVNNYLASGKRTDELDKLYLNIEYKP